MNVDGNRSERSGKRDDVRMSPISPVKRFAFRSTAVLLAVLPFVSAEVGLRLLGASDSASDSLIELDQLRPLFVQESAGGDWVIPERRLNFFRPARFSAGKPERTRRVFVLGGSTVQGRPWSTETAFSIWLRMRLESADPTRSYEVVNCGGVSYASYRVSKILKEVLGHQPDAIVLYTGHNEFLEDRSYPALKTTTTAGRWAGWLVTHSHLARALRDAWPTDSDHRQVTKMKEEVDARLDHIGGLEAYRRDPSWRSGIERHFDASLREMIEMAIRRGVPIIVCEPASDIVNTPPFKTELSPRLSEDERAEFAEMKDAALLEDLDDNARIERCYQCLEMDAEAAGVHYVLGRFLHGRGDSATAKRHLTNSRDFDVCPLRATSNIINSVRSACDEHDAPLVRTEGLLDVRDVSGQRRPDGIVDPEFFVDHVHPTVNGHQLIAATIAKEFESLGWGKQDNRAQVRYEAMVVNHLNGLGEDYYERGRERLEGLRRWATGRAAELTQGAEADATIGEPVESDDTIEMNTRAE